MSTVILRERDQDDDEIDRYTKRPKLDEPDNIDLPIVGEESQPSWDHVLPPSHALLGVPLPEAKEGGAIQFLESDVGISEYIGRGEAKIEGIIKQRFVSMSIVQEPC